MQLGSIPLPPQIHHPYPPQLHHPYPTHLPRHMFRNGASRERRRQKRAEAQRLAAADAAKELSPEEAEVVNLAEQAEKGNHEEVVESANNFQEPIDEFCSDSVYQNETTAEEVDPAELARDRIVAKIIVCPSTKPIEKKAKVENEIEEKFAAIGIEIKSMKTKADYRGLFDGSVVEIHPPVNLQRIWGRRLHLDNCSIISYEE